MLTPISIYKKEGTMLFNDKIKLQVNDCFYEVLIEGLKHYDAQDQIMYCEVDTITVLDEEGAYIDEDHPDYEEIYDYVQNGQYHVEA